MNPLKLSCHHGFFKSRIAFGQRRRQGNHVLHVHALSGKQHDFMAQACGFEAVVRYQHTRHALPLDFFHQHGDQNIAQIAIQTDERLVQQGKVAAAQQQAQKCYPFCGKYCAYRARFRRFQARNQTQNRRLATAARPEC